VDVEPIFYRGRVNFTTFLFFFLFFSCKLTLVLNMCDKLTVLFIIMYY